MPSHNAPTSAIKATLKIYLRHMLKNYRYTLPVAILASLGSILVFYTPALVVADIVSKASDQNVLNISNAWHYAVVFGLAWITGEMLFRACFWFIQRYEAKALHDFYQLAAVTLFEKDLSFFNNRFAGTITKNAVGFTRRFENFFDTIAMEIFTNFLPTIFALVVLAMISPILALTLFGMVLTGILIIKPLISKRLVLVKDREDKHAKLAGHISDIVTNIGTVKAHGLEDRELATHNRHSRVYTAAALKSWSYQNNRIDMIISPFYVMTNVLGLLIILSMGIDNHTKASLFIAFNYYANITRFLWAFSGIYRRLEEALAEGSLFVQYMLEPTKVVDRTSKELVVTEGRIDFEHVDFSHSSKKLFDDLNISISPGEKVGLVGHSGAGKTTIVSLLERFRDVDSGAILIDRQNIAEVTQTSLHHAISYVPQEPSLFHRSLRENIAYGKQDAREDEIIRAAKQANAWDFIEELPDKLDTMVGERGVKLSGGQRQRVAIARAILKDAPILVLDEATSALDSESEKLIQQSLETLMHGRTSIVIAHRLSTIAKLDRIIVLDQGKVIEDGNHSSLLTKNGTYAKLWHHQSGGFIEE